MKEIFKKYYRRMVRVGILNSIFLALILGFAVNFLVALITLFCDLSVAAVLGLSIGAGLLTMICAAPLLYHYKFKPTLNSMASVLDEKGLEERTVTMLQFEKEDSYVAKLQRENAIDNLKKVDPKSIKWILPTLALVLLSVSIALGVSMTTVSTLSAADVIGGFHDELPDDPDNPDDPDDDNRDEETVSILYEAGEHGKVEGVLFQKIPKGGDATTVVAIPDEGYEFSFWTDGIFTAERRDTNVTVSFSARAVFVKIVEVGPGQDGEGPGSGEGEGQGSQGGNQGNGPGHGEDGSGGDGGEGEDGQGSGGGGAGGSTAGDNNTVIDGSTDYHNEIDYEAAKDEILKDDTLSQEEKDMLLAYLETLMGDNQ